MDRGTGWLHPQDEGTGIWGHGDMGTWGRGGGSITAAFVPAPCRSRPPRTAERFGEAILWIAASTGGVVAPTPPMYQGGHSPIGGHRSPPPRAPCIRVRGPEMLSEGGGWEGLCW